MVCRFLWYYIFTSLCKSCKLFWATIDNFLTSYPFINCFYSSIFTVVVSSTAFILRRGLMDESEARLVSCWTRCCNLEVRSVVVKAELVFSREEVLGWGLDFNLDDGEGKYDVFGEALDLEAQRSLRCFCVVGELLWKPCVVEVDTIGGAAIDFGVNPLASLKWGFVVVSVQKRHCRRWNWVGKVPCVWWYQMVAVEGFCWFISMLQLNILWLLCQWQWQLAWWILSCKALMLAQVGWFSIVAILGMTSGLTGRSAKISAGFIIFGWIDDGTWARKSE